MNNKVRNLIIYIGVIILIFTVNFFYQKNKRSEVEKFGVDLIARFVYYKKFPKVSNYYFEFYYNKNKIKYIESRAPVGFHKNLGKYYKVKYLPKYPNLILVDFEREITSEKEIKNAGFDR